MTDTSVRSDNVDVEEIMTQIRSRIREKRGADYTEDEIRELANVKLEKFLDPRGVRSDLIEQYRRTQAAMPPAPNYAFEDSTMFESHRGFLRFMRRLLRPVLKLFFNPNPLIQALHIQSELNTRNAQREAFDVLRYEVMHNLVVETTRLGIEVKNLKMRLESMSSRLDFDERRARALEGVVQYRPGAAAPQALPMGGGLGANDKQGTEAEQAEHRNRRRRRRGRRRPADGRDGSVPRAGEASAADARETPSAGSSEASLKPHNGEDGRGERFAKASNAAEGTSGGGGHAGPVPEPSPSGGGSSES